MEISEFYYIIFKLLNSGPTCESQEGGICLNSEPCHNSGVCQEISDTKNQCLCPIGFAGQNCEHGKK